MSGRVWPGTAGRRSSTVRKVEQRRSPWTWAGETGRGATSRTAGLRALALPGFSGAFLWVWPKQWPRHDCTEPQ